MLVLHQFYHCFIYVLVCFYKFSGTNILTRCRSVSSCFLLFLVSEILHRKYSRKWTGQKPKIIYLPCQHRRPRGSRRHAAGRPHPSQARPRAGPRLGMVWAPWAPTDVALSPIYSPYREYHKSSSLRPRKVPPRRHHRRRDSGDRSLCSGTLPGRGIAPGANSIDSTAIFIAVADSHGEEGVVLP